MDVPPNSIDGGALIPNHKENTHYNPPVQARNRSCTGGFFVEKGQSQKIWDFDVKYVKYSHRMKENNCV